MAARAEPTIDQILRGGNAERMHELLDREPELVDAMMKVSVSYADGEKGITFVTPLYLAAQNGQLDCVKVLIIAGANPTKGDELDITPLIIAIAYNQNDIVEFLLTIPEVRLTINSTAKNGYVAPLHLAISQHNLPTTQALIAAGADPTLCITSGATPLEVAFRENDLRIIWYLLSIPSIRPTIRTTLERVSGTKPGDPLPRPLEVFANTAEKMPLPSVPRI